MRPLFAALALAAGCHVVSGLDTFELDAQVGGGGAGGMSSSGGDAPIGTGGSGGTAEPLVLVSRGVLARWFLDEPDSAALVFDAIAPPVDLSVELNGTGFPKLTGEPGVRGVTWDQAGTDGYVRTAIAGTKLESLDGAQQATIEAVLSLTAVSDGETRLIHFGANTESGRFSLRADDINTIELWIDDTMRVSWPVDLSAPRLVLHLVYDSDETDEADRARLYVGGALARDGSVASAISSGSSLDIASQAPVTFHIGNRDGSSPTDGRSAAGTYHYVALYDVALSALEVGTNAAALATRDDP